MSSFFDEASLVFIPSGYKTSKAYSVKPSDGSGDLAFTRSNDTATRVNSAGLIEKVRTNLQTYSQNFTNAVWVPDLVSITGGQTDPNGGTTAALVTATASSSVYFYTSSSTVGTYSIYAKAGSRSNFSILNGSYNNGGSFNLATQTATSSGQGSLAKIEDVGGGWYRCSVYISSASIFLIALSDISGGGMNSGDTMYFAFAQRETGDIATPYIATTTAAVSVGPVANVPRLDYLNSSCPRLLLEPQRTNLATYSEQFTNAAWTGGGSTGVANQGVSPDGYTNADLIYPTSSGNFTGKYQNLAAGTTGVVSCYVKQAGKRFAQLGTDNNATYTCAFDLQLGTVVRTATNYTATITSVGNGWFRITAAYVSSAAASYPFVGVSDNAAGGVTVDGTNGLYVYGFQYETSAAYATSYIPTLGASVTRSSDVCNKTSVASLIGQTEGTLFAEVSFDDIGAGGGSAYVYFTDGSFANAVIVGREPASPNSKFFFYIQASSVSILNNTTNNITSGVVKMAIAYKSGDWAAYLNGNLVASGSTTFTFNASMSRIGIGTNDGAITITGSSTRAAQALLFKTRLTNAQLAELTA